MTEISFLDKEPVDERAVAHGHEEASPHRSSRRDQQIQRILDAAKQCFVAYGFQGASMNQICAAAGMSPGALYRYFPSKESIIQAITENDRRDDACLFAAMFDNPSIIDGLVTAGLAHMRYVKERDIAPLFAEIRSESMRNPVIAETCFSHKSEIAERFRHYIEDAVSRGDIAPRASVNSVLMTLMAIGEGLALNNPLSAGVPEAEFEAILRGIITGLLCPTKTEGQDK